MKKLITCCVSLLSVGMYAQSLSAYVISSQSGANTATITNGTNLQLYTTESNILGKRIKFINNSAITHTYNMSRQFVTETPTLDKSGDGNIKPNAYFCFGIFCFGSNIDAADATNYTILAPGKSSEDPADPKPAYIYLSEAQTKGYYVIHYKIFDVNNPNDSLGFNAVYNNPVGMKDLGNNVLTGISELYPNPTSGSAVSFDLAKDDELKFQVYNSLGSLVYAGSKQKYSAGKNKLAFDAASLSNGVYFVTISDNNSAKITKRLVVNK
jgi:hypothetical protein